MPKLGAAEWWKAHADLLNVDEKYRKYAKGFTNVFEFDVGDLRTISEFVDGEIVDVHEAAEGEEGLIIIEAPIETWIDFVKGNINPKTALFGGKFKVKKGKVTTLTKYVGAAGIIFDAMLKVPTEY